MASQLKHPENFITYRYVKNSYEELITEYEGLVALSEVGKKADKNIVSQKKITKIQVHFAKANSLYYAGKYQNALDEYKLTHGLIYESMNPSFSGDLARNPNVVLPLDKKVFEPMLKSCLILIDAISPIAIGTSIGGNPLILENSIIKTTEKYAELGVHVSDGLSRTVKSASMMGMEYANQGEWVKADHFFNSALKAIGRGSTPAARKAKASLNMNLGAVALQQGNIAKAKIYTKNAINAFKRSKDTCGEAQSNFNLATIYNKEGKKDSAKKTYVSAEKLLKKAHGKSDAIDLTSGSTTVTTPITCIPTYTAITRSVGLLGLGTRAAELTSMAITKDYAGLSGTKGSGVIFRVPTAEGAWITQDLTDKIDMQKENFTKEINLLMGDNIVKFTWKNGSEPDHIKVKKELFEKRILTKDLKQIKPVYELKTDFASRLPHLYFYQIPVCIADCYHKLGEYSKALSGYLDAAGYDYVNKAIEIPALWLKIATNYLEWGNMLYKKGEPQNALVPYTQVIKPNDSAPATAPLYKNPLKIYGDKVKLLLASIDNPGNSALNPKLKSTVLDIRLKIQSIAAGLDFWGFPANLFPIFKFDYLQSIAQYFCQQASQAEKQYISFASQGENEELTRTQLENSIDMAQAEIDLSEKQIEYSEAQLEVNKENADLVAQRITNAQAAKAQYANVSHDMAHLDAASAFASGPEGYSVSYTYYSDTEGKNVTVSGSDAYKVMKDAALKKGMLSRRMELDNMQRNINELVQSKAIADAQKAAAQKQVAISQQQKKIAEMNKDFAEDMLNSFESQNFTPEIWFQLANHLLYISKSYLWRAIGIAKKMQKAYELETGEDLKIIKSSYNTNILSGLLGADYLLKDVDYFTVHRIYSSKSKDVPIVQSYSLAQLNPLGFEITFKQTGMLEFETSFGDFDFNYPGSYLRKLRKVEVIVEGLLPPGGLHGSLKNSGISRTRKRNGSPYYRIQPRETQFISSHRPKQDIAIFQPDSRVLGVFENCGVASGWTIELPKSSNDLNYDTISDIKVIFYYTARHYAPLEASVKNTLPQGGEQSMVIPFRVLFPDEYFSFLDSGELNFDLRTSDFPYNQMDFKSANLSLRVKTSDGVSNAGITAQLTHVGDGTQASMATDASGTIKTDATDNQNPLNVLINKGVLSGWKVTVSDADNPGFDRNNIKDMFLFIEYSFKYKG